MLKNKASSDFGKGGDLNTIIGKGSVVDGDLKVQSTLRVDGKIKGKVATSESIVIGKDGEIEGEVMAKNAVIGGKLKGKLHATGKVILEANSKFVGELKTAKLVIDEGAYFDGTCIMKDEKIKFSPGETLKKAIPTNETSTSVNEEIKAARPS